MLKSVFPLKKNFVQDKHFKNTRRKSVFKFNRQQKRLFLKNFGEKFGIYWNPCLSFALKP